MMRLSLEEIEQFIINAGSDNLPTFGGEFEGGIQCQQVPNEIAPCIYDILNSGRKINSFLEIGAAAGGTTYLIDHFFQPENIVLIDDNRHPKAHVRPYILSGIDRKEIIGLSQAKGTMDALGSTGLKFDLMLIDGDHTYNGVKADVENYLPFLADGGFLMLHDSALDAWGVKPVTMELKQSERLEFFNEYIGKGPVCGIALFRKAANENQ